MNKNDLSKLVAERLGSTDKHAAEVVDLVLSLIEEALVGGDKVALSGFGTFQVRERAPREGRNPQTGETMHIPGRKAPAFTAGKRLKKSVQ